MAVRIAIEPWPDVRLTSDTEADIGENGLEGATSFYDISADLGDPSVLLCRTAAANDRTDELAILNQQQFSWAQRNRRDGFARSERVHQTPKLWDGTACPIYTPCT